MRRVLPFLSITFTSAAAFLVSSKSSGFFVVLTNGHLYLSGAEHVRVYPLNIVFPEHLNLIPWKRFLLGIHSMYPLQSGTFVSAILSFLWHLMVRVNDESMKFPMSMQTSLDSSLQAVLAGQRNEGPNMVSPSHSLTLLFRSQMNP